MKTLNLITLILVIIGGLSLGMLGLFGFDLMAAITGGHAMLLRVAYLLVGASAVWQVYPLVRAFETGEVHAERFG